jgi:pimeloyl-ACP methyl ester carboxylesterase
LTVARLFALLLIMPFADVHGQRIHYQDSGGSGPAVVLAHGFLMDQSMFDPQVATLAPEVRVVRWDARGHGQTGWDGEPFTYWDLASDAIALLDHLGLERAILGGMSQGGFVALRAALTRPERVKGLVLIDTQAGVDDAATIAGYRQMLDTWMAMGAIDPLVSTIAGLILGAAEHWEPWTSRWREIPANRLRESAACLLERDDITARLGEIRCPAIAFHGTADKAIHPDRGEAMVSRLAGCEAMVRVEGAAHAANLTHAAAVNPALRAFVLRHG